MSFKTLLCVTLLALAAHAGAQTSPVQITDAWARATVNGQRGTGAFMSLMAPAGAQLVGVSTPAAGVAEVHQMKMQGDVMRMRAVPTLELPRGEKVVLSPGGYHVMLMELKTSLVPGSTVPMTLTFKDASGKRSTQKLNVPVTSSAPPGSSAGNMHHH